MVQDSINLPLSSYSYSIRCPSKLAKSEKNGGLFGVGVAVGRWVGVGVGARVGVVVGASVGVAVGIGVGVVTGTEVGSVDRTGSVGIGGEVGSSEAGIEVACGSTDIAVGIGVPGPAAVQARTVAVPTMTIATFSDIW